MTKIVQFQDNSRKSVDQITKCAEDTNPQAQRALIASCAALRMPFLPDEYTAREVMEVISISGRPADKKWIGVQVVAALSHYRNEEKSLSVSAIIASHWLNDLSEYPAFAIEDAFKWWRSKDNPKRQFQPQTGDIAERAEIAMAPIKAARNKLHSFEKYRGHYPAWLSKPQERERQMIGPEELEKRRQAVKSAFADKTSIIARTVSAVMSDMEKAEIAIGASEEPRCDGIGSE